GCGQGRGLAKGPYNSGSAPELGLAVNWGRLRHPDKRHIAIGFSLSGNALLLLLSRGEGPDGAIAVNAPIDLAACSDAISTGFNRVYDVRFVHQCRIDPRARGKGIKPWHTLREVDERYTAPAAGYRDAADYYETCSAGPRMGTIDRPTVLLTAADDPFVPIESYENLDLNRSIHLHVEPVGGHMGYLAAGPRRRWLDGALDAYVDWLSSMSS
ncbi:MAG: thioesterase, partial [Planctomycetota bacterium]